jgi:hypothetical protein
MTSLQLSVTRLKNVSRRVHEAGVNITKLLESKEVGGMLGILEDIRGGAVEWNSSRGSLPCDESIQKDKK